jgi:alkanesulfonate monooxygenase SsuD/methylene tetrahydromethanopterin reductase-like flavin-dependent oxidoreductase (luciferase family)
MQTEAGPSTAGGGRERRGGASAVRPLTLALGPTHRSSMIALGVQTWSTDVVAVERFWRAADELGYARITYGDGLWDFTHDGWTMLGALARVTQLARIGPAVTYAFAPAAHHPAWLAKRAVTVDHLSGGRLDLRMAIGAPDAATRAAWEQHGIRYPGTAGRLAALDEALAIITALWRGEIVTTDGPVFRLRGARLAPGPVQRPGPPVWIAAMAPRALAMTAHRADGWEASYLTPADFAARSARLDALLVDAGRCPEEMRRSVEIDVILAGSRAEQQAWLGRFRAERGDRADAVLATALAGDADTVVARIAEYAAAGATDLMLGFADFPATGMLERFARDVAPRLTAGSR